MFRLTKSAPIINSHKITKGYKEIFSQPSTKRMMSSARTHWPLSQDKLLQSNLFKHQNSLGKVPLPENGAEFIRNNYLRTLEPLLDSKSFSESKRVTEEFICSKQFVSLDKRLRERRERLKEGWLLEWWNKYAYLKDREPVVFYVNYFYHYDDQVFEPSSASEPSSDMESSNTKENREFHNIQTRRAAALIVETLKFKALVISGELEADQIKNYESPLYLCSHMYRYLFNACRIPQMGRYEDPSFQGDTIKISDPNQNTHIIIIHKNRFFKYNPYAGQVLDVAKIQGDLQCIVKMFSTEEAFPIGILTTEGRNEWAEARTHLSRVSLQNKENLGAIESAAFVVCLDSSPSNPTNLEKVSRIFWHGDGKNRFFDKPFQLIVCKNGKSGLNAEHSMMDGAITHRMNQFILGQLNSSSEKENSQTQGIPMAEESQNIQHLKFTVDEKTKIHIENAQKNFAFHESMHQFSILKIESLNVKLVKSWKLSADALIQMAFQLAYYSLKKEFVSVYETAQTRKYLYGRTEAIRSTSKDSAQWIKSMMQSPAGGSSEGLLLEQRRLLNKALETHKSQSIAASNGQGVDRYLLGLELSLRHGEPRPEFFSDPGFKLSKEWRLSSSQLSSDYYSSWGWGEVNAKGYGLPYFMNNKGLYVGIASRGENTKAFKKALHKAFVDIQALISSTNNLALKEPQAKL